MGLIVVFLLMFVIASKLRSFILKQNTNLLIKIVRLKKFNFVLYKDVKAVLRAIFPFFELPIALFREQ
jgi:hypothetical protein